jgi:hypothetical protein
MNSSLITKPGICYPSCDHEAVFFVRFKQIWFPNSAWLLTALETLNKSSNLYEPSFPHLENGLPIFLSTVAVNLECIKRT